MHGPRLTPQEAVASVARQVRDLEAQGLHRDRAIGGVASATRIAAEKVRWCSETAFPVSIARGVRSSARRSRSLAIAAGDREHAHADERGAD